MTMFLVAWQNEQMFKNFILPTPNAKINFPLTMCLAAKQNAKMYHNILKITPDVKIFL
jgi:hypothetical protein